MSNVKTPMNGLVSDGLNIFFIMCKAIKLNTAINTISHRIHIATRIASILSIKLKSDISLTATEYERDILLVSDHPNVPIGIIIAKIVKIVMSIMMIELVFLKSFLFMISPNMNIKVKYDHRPVGTRLPLNIGIISL